jgi:hypothetical protein
MMPYLARKRGRDRHEPRFVKKVEPAPSLLYIINLRMQSRPITKDGRS